MPGTKRYFKAKVVHHCILMLFKADLDNDGPEPTTRCRGNIVVHGHEFDAPCARSLAKLMCIKCIVLVLLLMQCIRTVHSSTPWNMPGGSWARG